MKKLVSMLLIVGIIASLFTCISVSAATVEPAYVFKAGTNVAYNSAGGSKLYDDTFDGKDVLVMESTTTYTQVNFKFNSDFSTKNTYYVKFKYRLDEEVAFNTDSSKNYIQVAFDKKNWIRVANSYPDNAKTEWITSDVIEVAASSIDNDVFDFDFNGVTGKVYVEYIAFFNTKDDAERYGSAESIPDVTVNGTKATRNNDNKTVSFEFDRNTSADTMKAATYVLGDFTFSGDWQEVADSNYTFLTRKMVANDDSANVWTLKIKSLKLENVLDFIDFTDPDNADKLVKPGNDRETGVATTGNISTVYFKRVGESDTLDNWCTVTYDQTKVTADKEVYAKIAYRFGDDVSAITTNQQKELHFEFGPGGWQRIAVYGVDNIPTWKWNTAVVKCSARSNDKQFYIGTFGIYGKVLIKYVAFFETEEDANNYKFGDIGATISTDGKSVNAVYDNLEGTNGSRILALYQDDELKKVVYSTSNDEISATDLDAGTYTAKAFYWNNLDEGYPNFDGTTETVTIN